MSNQTGYEALTVSTTAVGPTAATITARVRSALFYVKGAAVRWRADGTAPTASAGTPIEDGGSLMVTGEGVCRNIQFIRRDSVDAAVHIMAFDEPLDIRGFAPFAIEGLAASDAPEQGSPVQIGGSVDATSPAAAGEGDVRRIRASVEGNMLVTIMSGNSTFSGRNINSDALGSSILAFDTVSYLHGFAPDGSWDRLRTVGDAAPGLGVLAASPASPGSSDTKMVAVDVAATSASRQTLLTPTAGKKVRIISAEVVTRGLTTNPDRVGVYFASGAAYMTTVAKAISEFVPGTTGKQRSEWPDGGGPVGAADDVISGITETETELTMRYTIVYREE